MVGVAWGRTDKVETGHLKTNRYHMIGWQAAFCHLSRFHAVDNHHRHIRPPEGFINGALWDTPKHLNAASIMRFHANILKH